MPGLEFRDLGGFWRSVTATTFETARIIAGKVGIKAHGEVEGSNLDFRELCGLPGLGATEREVMEVIRKSGVVSDMNSTAVRFAGA